MLEHDQKFILALIDQPIAEVDCERDLVFLLSVSKFGQKSEKNLVVAEVVKPTGIKRMSIHVAINVEPNLPSSPKGLHLL